MDTSNCNAVQRQTYEERKNEIELNVLKKCIQLRKKTTDIIIQNNFHQGFSILFSLSYFQFFVSFNHFIFYFFIFFFLLLCHFLPIFHFFFKFLDYSWFWNIFVICQFFNLIFTHFFFILSLLVSCFIYFVFFFSVYFVLRFLSNHSCFFDLNSFFSLLIFLNFFYYKVFIQLDYAFIFQYLKKHAVQH